jgi:hypothetical protein
LGQDIFKNRFGDSLIERFYNPKKDWELFCSEKVSANLLKLPEALGSIEAPVEAERSRGLTVDLAQNGANCAGREWPMNFSTEILPKRYRLLYKISHIFIHNDKVCSLFGKCRSTHNLFTIYCIINLKTSLDVIFNGAKCFASSINGNCSRIKKLPTLET